MFMLEHNAFSNTPISSYIGRYIGGYRITQELAAGPTSRTLLGETASLTEREPVVIKWFSTLHLETAWARQEFLREAGRLRRLQHPALLPILSSGIYTDTPYLVLPYLSQGSLADRLQQPTGREWARPRALTLVRRLGQALILAHRQNIIHGNLKMHNILFNSQDDILLADFSLTSLIRPLAMNNGSSSASHPPTVPRQPVPADDVYSLGCIAYELLTGKPPFPNQEKSTPSGHALPIALSWFDTRIAPYVEEAILKALAPQPGARYGDISAFLRALDPPTTIMPSVSSSSAGETSPLLDQAPTAPIVVASLQPSIDTDALPTTHAVTTAIPLSSDPPAISRMDPRMRSSRHPWSLFLFAAALCLVIFSLIGFQLLVHISPNPTRQYAAVPRTTPAPLQNPQVFPTLNPTPTATHANRAKPTPTATPRALPTPHPTPQQALRFAHVPRSTPTPAPPPVQAASSLSAAPASLSPQACLSEQDWYYCTVSLSLSDDASGLQTWEGSTSGFSAIMAPQRGLISPGSRIRISIQISAHCPTRGSLFFNTSDASTSIAWHC
jgi:serine/threonine protein kinase